MQLTNYTICSDDIKEFERSTDTDTIRWLKFFKGYNPYDVPIEKQNKLRKELDTVKKLAPFEMDSNHFKTWDIKQLVYASRADLGKVPPATSIYAYGILIARMVLAYYLVQGKKNLPNGQTIAEQVQALGFNLEEK